MTTPTPSGPAVPTGTVSRADELPSDFFRQNVFCSFQEDVQGIRDRYVIGIENLMWGSDYPHQESTFPKSREILEKSWREVS